MVCSAPFSDYSKEECTSSLLPTLSPFTASYQVHRGADAHLANIDGEDCMGAGALDIHLGAGCGAG